MVNRQCSDEESTYVHWLAGREFLQIGGDMGIRNEDSGGPQYRQGAEAAPDRYRRMQVVGKSVVVEMLVGKYESADPWFIIGVETRDVGEHSLAAELFVRPGRRTPRPVGAVWSSERHAEIKE